VTGFRFGLEKVLEWRRLELEREESAFQRKLAALADLDRRHAELEAAALRAEIEVRESKGISGTDLAALGGFRTRARNEQQRLSSLRAACEKEAAAQRTAMLEARRRLRLFERLRERRWQGWERARDRELEELAAEAYLARKGPPL
jgi:flagellar export protein FliJ